MSVENTMTETAARHVTEAAAFRLMGLMLERPRPRWRDELSSLAPEVGDPALAEMAAAAVLAHEPEYLALLGPGGAISPRQAAYIGMEDPGKRLNQLLELFEAYGYQPLDAEDPPDHMAVELGFAAFLSLKAAHAEMSEDPVALAAAVRAREHFIKEHLGPFVTAFLEKISEVEAGPAYVSQTLVALSGRLSLTGEVGPCQVS